MRRVASRDVARWSARSMRASLPAVSHWQSRREQSSHGPSFSASEDDAVRTSFPGDDARREATAPRRPPSELDRIVQDLNALNREQREQHVRAKVAASPDDVTRVLAEAGETSAETQDTTGAARRASFSTVNITAPPSSHRAPLIHAGNTVPRSPPSWTATLELAPAEPNPALSVPASLDAADISAVSFTLEELDEQLFNATAEQPVRPPTTTAVRKSDTAESIPRPPPPPPPPSAPSPTTEPAPVTAEQPRDTPEPPAFSSSPLPPPPPSAPAPPGPVAAAAGGAACAPQQPPTPPLPPPPPPAAPRPTAAETVTMTATKMTAPEKPEQPAVLPKQRAPVEQVTPQPPPTPATEKPPQPCITLDRDETGALQIQFVAEPLSVRALIDALQEAFDRVEASVPAKADNNGRDGPLTSVHLSVCPAMRTRVEDKVVTEHLFFDVAAAAASEVALTPLERFHLNDAKDKLLRRLLTAPQQRGWQLVAHLHKGAIARDFGAELLFCCGEVDLTRARGGLVSIGLPSLALGVFPSAYAVRAFARRLQALDAAELTKLLQTAQVSEARLRQVLPDQPDSAAVSLDVATRAAAELLPMLHRQDESATGFNRLLTASPLAVRDDEAVVYCAASPTPTAATTTSLFQRLTSLARSVTRPGGATSDQLPLTGREANPNTLTDWWRRYCRLSASLPVAGPAAGANAVADACAQSLLAASRTVEATNGRRVFLAVNAGMGLADYAQGSTCTVRDTADRWVFVTADKFSPDADAPAKVCQAVAQKAAAAADSPGSGPVLLFISNEYPASLALQVLASLRASESAVDAHRYVTILTGQPGATAECASVVPLSVTLTAAGVPGGRGVEEELLLHEAARTRPDRARDARLLNGLLEVSVRSTEAQQQDEVAAATAAAALNAAVGYLRQRRVPYVVVSSGSAGLRLAVSLADAILAVAAEQPSDATTTTTTSSLAAIDAHLAEVLQSARSPAAVVTRHFGFQSASFDEAHRRFPRETQRLTSKKIFDLSKRIRKAKPQSKAAGEAAAAGSSPRAQEMTPAQIETAVEAIVLQLVDTACTLLVSGDVRCAADMDLLSVATLSLRATSGGLLTVAEQRFAGAAGLLAIARRHTYGKGEGRSEDVGGLSAPSRALLAFMVERDITFDQLTEARLARFRDSQ